MVIPQTGSVTVVFAVIVLFMCVSFNSVNAAPAAVLHFTFDNLMNSDLTLQLVDNHRQFLGFLERRLGDRALAEDSCRMRS